MGDRVMIDRLAGREQAGIYGLAYNLSLFMSIIISEVNASFTPWLYQVIKAQCYGAIKKIANLLVVLFAGLTLLFIAVAPEIIRIISKPEYFEAIWIIPSVAVAIFFTFLYTLFCNIEFYFEKTYFVMIASVIAAVSNIYSILYLFPGMVILLWDIRH
jgi:O-antigen/teichoic acid export membrane protein